MVGIAIERLTCFNFLCHVLPQVIALKARDPRGGIKLCFIDASVAGEWMGRQVLGLMGASLQRLSFRLLDIRDPDGDLTRISLVYGDLGSIQQQFCTEPFFKEIFKMSVDSLLLC